MKLLSAALRIGSVMLDYLGLGSGGDGLERFTGISCGTEINEINIFLKYLPDFRFYY